MVLAGASFLTCVFLALVIVLGVVFVVFFFLGAVFVSGFFLGVIFFLVEVSVFFFFGTRLGARVGGGEGE